ncbi:MAG TPA: Rossmann-like and DUF2520 domain-containing protein [Acidobacteriaceae bacterium]|nr:Rossmann-like and DUF2520 domain-containing protein [Acidobacteriaceae bacterium]
MGKDSGGGVRTGVAIIGPGNWGTSLAHALHEARIPVRELIVSRMPARRRSGGETAVTTLDCANLDAAILWLCVPDSSIAETARSLVERKKILASRRPGPAAPRSRLLRGQIVVHSSGALSAEVLRPAALAGAAVASVHPLMTFPARRPVALSDVPFAVEAEEDTRRKLNTILREVGGRPFPIAGSAKALYHAVGMLASPLLVSLIAAALETAGHAGLAPRQARRLLEPIVQTTLKNVFTRGLADSFSGPIARGDVTAIDLHLQALMPHPILADLYRSLAIYALEALPSRNSNEIRRVLERSTSRRGRRTFQPLASNVRD